MVATQPRPALAEPSAADWGLPRQPAERSLPSYPRALADSDWAAAVGGGAAVEDLLQLDASVLSAQLTLRLLLQASKQARRQAQRARSESCERAAAWAARCQGVSLEG